MGEELKTFTKFSDIINILLSKITPDYINEEDYANSILMTSIIYYKCNFDLILVGKDITDTYYNISNLYKCVGAQFTVYNNNRYSEITLLYEKLNNSEELNYLNLDVNYIHISSDNNVIYINGLYISDRIIYIEKHLSECFNKEINAKLDEIAAIYNKYSFINKLSKI